MHFGAAIKAGLLGGTVALFLFQFLGTVLYDESPWKLVRMIAAIVSGPGVLEPDDEFDAGLTVVAVALHYTLAVLYSLAIARLLVQSPRRYGALVGLAFGVALYHVNLFAFTTLFPWFAPYRTVDTFLIHAAFGALTAKAYWFYR